MSWVEEIDQTVSVNPHFVLTGESGNDVVLVEQSEPGSRWGDARVLPIIGALREIGQRVGLDYLVVADPVTGFQMMEVCADAGELRSATSGRLSSLPSWSVTPSYSQTEPSTPADLSEVMRAIASSEQIGGLVVVDGGRWCVDLANLQDDEHALFTLAASIARHTPRRRTRRGREVFSPMIWLCRTAYELPSWYVSSQGVRSIEVPPPGRSDREAFGASRRIGEEDVIESFGDGTDGMSVRELRAVADLVVDGRPIADAATLVRLGVVDDPWTADDLMDRISSGDQFLAERVRGQEHALSAAWAAITRSLVGLSGIHRRAHGRRPRIVLFLAGPTGTGKTELAKALAELVFGSREALIRFDMSGYSEGHSNQRLIGSPPGYVGHEAGGELTNAVRARPFSVVLFDEIEKAHSQILELFLQVLDEGHLDDSLGRRVHFDQSVIIFTSNLGITERRVLADHSTETVYLVDDSMPYSEISPRVLDAIGRHFKEVLSRAEILNRLGDNLVVFDFLRPAAALEVFSMLMDNVQAGIAERHGIDLQLDPAARAALEEACCATVSEFGGRGIENKVESLLVNPLSVWMFDHRTIPKSWMRVTRWEPGDPPQMTVEHGVAS